MVEGLNGLLGIFHSGTGIYSELYLVVVIITFRGGLQNSKASKGCEVDVSSGTQETMSVPSFLLQSKLS